MSSIPPQTLRLGNRPLDYFLAHYEAGDETIVASLPSLAAELYELADKNARSLQSEGTAGRLASSASQTILARCFFDLMLTSYFEEAFQHYGDKELSSLLVDALLYQATGCEASSPSESDIRDDGTQNARGIHKYVLGGQLMPHIKDIAGWLFGKEYAAIQGNPTDIAFIIQVQRCSVVARAHAKLIVQHILHGTLPTKSEEYAINDSLTLEAENPLDIFRNSKEATLQIEPEPNATRNNADKRNATDFFPSERSTSNAGHENRDQIAIENACYIRMPGEHDTTGKILMAIGLVVVCAGVIVLSIFCIREFQKNDSSTRVPIAQVNAIAANLYKLASDQNNISTVYVGETAIILPTPSGYYRVDAKNEQIDAVFHASVGKNVRALAWYGSEVALAETLSGKMSNDRGISLQALTGTLMEKIPVSNSKFESLKTTIKESNALFDGIGKQGMEEAGSRAMSIALGKVSALKVGEMIPLGIFDETLESISYSFLIKWESLSVDGEGKGGTVFFGAQSQVLVRGHLIQLGCGTIYHNPSEFPLVRDVLKQWKNSVVIANNERPNGTGLEESGTSNTIGTLQNEVRSATPQMAATSTPVQPQDLPEVPAAPTATVGRAVSGVPSALVLPSPVSQFAYVDDSVLAARFQTVVGFKPAIEPEQLSDAYHLIGHLEQIAKERFNTAISSGWGTPDMPTLHALVRWRVAHESWTSPTAIDQVIINLCRVNMNQDEPIIQEIVRTRPAYPRDPYVSSPNPQR